MNPFFSIIIPTYKRPAQLAVCLEALARIDYPRDKFEVIVVDDGGHTPAHIVTDYQAQFNFRLVTQPHAGPAAARNTGAKHARGAYFAFTDDDCAPRPNWLKAFAAQLARTPDHLIGGHTVNALYDNHCAAASQLLIDYLYDYYNRREGQAVFFTSNNMAIAAHGFRTLGGFDTSFPLAAGEDRELCDRWRHHGFAMTYTPEAIIEHRHDLSLRRFWRQHFNYGRSALHFHRTRASRCQRKLEVEPAAFYLKLLRYPLTRTRDTPRKLILCGLFGISQAANACGYFVEKHLTTSSN